MKYEVIQTGSDGNCTIVEDLIAIDMGIPFYKIEPYAPYLRLVLLTHEHCDHFRTRTVRKLARERPNLKWACRDWMVGPLTDQKVDRRNIFTMDAGQWDHYPAPLNLLISPFDTRHNVPNCGWKLWRNAHDSIFYATDLGDLDGITAPGFAVYLLEANHREAEIAAREEEKLESGLFSYEAAARENHLSWEQATEWLRQNMSQDSIWIPMHEHKERERQDGQQNPERDN